MITTSNVAARTDKSVSIDRAKSVSRNRIINVTFTVSCIPLRFVSAQT